MEVLLVFSWVRPEHDTIFAGQDYPAAAYPVEYSYRVNLRWKFAGSEPYSPVEEDLSNESGGIGRTGNSVRLCNPVKTGRNGTV